MIQLYSLTFAGTFTCLAFYVFTNREFILVFLNTNPAKSKHKLRLSNPEVPQPPSFSTLHSFEHAAVCSDSDVCSRIGSNVLEQNGGAIDAAIATLLCNGLVTMQSMGPGGGMLMMYYSRSEQHSCSILSREVAPLRSKPGTFTALKNASQLLQSGLTIAVPAELMGYARVHARFGKLAWARLVQPTLDICRKGFKLSKHQRDALETNREMVQSDPHLRAMFVDPVTKNFYHYGTHIRPVSKLCDTYAHLLKYGAESMYKGELAKQVLADLQDLKSNIDSQDLSKLDVKITSPLVTSLNQNFLHLMPPAGSGFIVGFIMKLLEQFSKDFMSAKDLGEHEMQRIVEALKFGFVKRWELDTQTSDSIETFKNITCEIYAAKLSKLINDFTHTDPQYYGADMTLVSYPEHGTAHISVLAPNGDAVSVTSSINFYFGSGRTGSRTGILFNNAMSDFTLDNVRNYFDLPNMRNKNRIVPGRSPMSSMAPMIVTNAQGDVRLIIGAAGGSKIISVLTQILVRVLWLKQNIKEAIDAPRFHHQLLPNILEYEYGVVQRLIDHMEARGHKTKRYRERGSAVCGIESKQGKVYANVDYRKDGGVAGF